MPAVFLIVFGLLWSGITLVIDVNYVSRAGKQYQSGRYATATGTLTHSDVRVRRTSKGRSTYTPVLAYVYEVDSQTYAGSKIRFVRRSDSKDYAYQIVSEHPAGSKVTVYYDPKHPEAAILDPGIEGGDVLMLLLGTPFNVVMIGLWIAVANLVRRRNAGGVKIINEGATIRVRLPQYSPSAWGLTTAAVLGIICFVAIALPTGMQPPLYLAVDAVIAVYVVAAIVWLRQCWINRTGVNDLVINKTSGFLVLPLTYGRTTPTTVAMRDVEVIWVEKIEHKTNKGSSFTYAPTLYIPRRKKRFEKLANWGDEDKATHFTLWLSEQINAPIRWHDAVDYMLKPASPV